MDFQLRTYAFIDSMQPQAAAHVASTCQGDVPIAGMSELFIEVAPGNEIFRCADVALKAADVRPALQIVEREFGLLEIHSRTQSEVQAAGQAVLEYLGLKEEDRVRPKIASSQFVTNVNPYQAQLINKWRKGNLLLAAIQPLRARSDACRLCHPGRQRSRENSEHQPDRGPGRRTFRPLVHFRHGKRSPERRQKPRSLRSKDMEARMSVVTAAMSRRREGVLVIGARRFIDATCGRSREGTRCPH